MSKEKYFVYRYDWPNGEYYIGRSKESAKRYNNANSYINNQYVGKFMLMPHSATKLRISSNPFIIAFEEARLLQQHYYDKFCLNGRLETKDTEISSMFTSSSKKDYEGNMTKMLNDWLEAAEEYGDTIY